jgi:hypothetical protein
MSEWVTLDGKTRKLRKHPKNKSRKNIQDNEKIWGNYGSVYSNKKNIIIKY